MASFKVQAARRAAIIFVIVGVLTACGNSTDASYPLPSEPAEGALYDLVNGPVNRASSLNLVSGRGTGVPTVLRVDNTDQWDFCFAVVDSQPSWLPRGYFEGFDASSGVVELQVAFDDVVEVPSDADAYEDSAAVPITVGATYALRSRPDPTVSVACRQYAKVEVVSVEGDPARLEFRIFWNPNCNATNVAS